MANIREVADSWQLQSGEDDLKCSSRHYNRKRPVLVKQGER